MCGTCGCKSAETKLSKTSCCCGADEANPCACMKAPEPMNCSAKAPKCACYKALEKNAEFLYFYVLNEKGESPADFNTLEEAQTYVANSSEPLEIYERRSRDDEAYKMDKKMNAETFESNSNKIIVTDKYTHKKMALVGKTADGTPIWNKATSTGKIPKNARAYTTSLYGAGWYERLLNGERHSRHEMPPKRTEYQLMEEIYHNYTQWEYGPENLWEDGEASLSRVKQKLALSKRKIKIAEKELGRKVSKTQAIEWAKKNTNFENYGAETFEAAIIRQGDAPKGAMAKAMMNKSMMEQANIEAMIQELENKVNLGLISEDELMASLKKKFGAEYDIEVYSSEELSKEDLEAYFADLKKDNPKLAKIIEFKVKNEEYLPKKMIEDSGYDYEILEAWNDSVIDDDKYALFDPCPACEGEGWIMTSYTPATRWDPADGDGEDCEECGGSGKIDPSDYMYYDDKTEIQYAAETQKIPEYKVVVIDGEEYNIYIGDLYAYGWDGSQVSYKLYKEWMSLSYDGWLNIWLQSKNGDGKGNWLIADGERKEIEDWLKRKFNPKEINFDTDGDFRRDGETTGNIHTMYFSLNDKVLEFFGIKIPSKPPSKKDCSEGCTWSNAYIRNDYGLEDDGTASVEYGQRCEVCDVERRGSISGEVSWDMNAEGYAAETKKRKAGFRKCSKCGDYNHNAPNCNRLNEYEEYLKHKDEMLRQCDRAIDEFTRDAKRYSEDGEYGMAKMTRSDATDMKKLKRMIEKNHFGKAVHFAMGMDSQPRDLAPSALWLFASEEHNGDY